MRLFVTAIILLLLSVPVSAGKKVSSSTIRQQQKRELLLDNLMLEELPDTGEQWMTAHSGMEFQPAKNLSPLAAYHLRKLTWYDTNDEKYPYRGAYVDGGETYYDEYAQAWRALGFYIDCDYCGDDDDDDGDCQWWLQNNDDNNNRRRLPGDDDSGCKRFLLWAAYVDEGYQGNGVHEYQYYDRRSGKWSDKACYMANDQGRDPNYNYSSATVSQYSTRCVKMDCHLENTHFSLLGYFKEPHYDEWMEQLFKHEGDCVWTDEEYQFMQDNRETWPDGCTASETYFDEDNNNSTLYYDLKPEPYGSMSVGIYTDSKCIVEYTGKKYTAEMLFKAGQDEDDDAGGDPDSLATLGLDKYLRLWNDAFDVFKQCQPCKAYMLTDIVAGIGYKVDKNNRYQQDYYPEGEEDNRRRLPDDDDDDGSFRCHDDAGYDCVNQCMKFKTKTRMELAKGSDVVLAGYQGTITRIPIHLTSKIPSYTGNAATQMSGFYFGSSQADKKSRKVRNVLDLFFFFVSILFFLFVMNHYFRVQQDTSEILIEPLVMSSTGVTT